MPLQGSGGPFVRSGGAGRVTTTKGLTGIPFVRRAGAAIASHRSFDEVEMWSPATRAGARAAGGDDLTMTGDVRPVHEAAEGRSVLRRITGRGQLGNKFGRARSAARSADAVAS